MKEFILILIISIFIGIIAGLLGTFYRNCLKLKGMIFYSLYDKVLRPMAQGNNKFLSFIAFPLGYCIYCSSTWIAIILNTIALTLFETLPWQIIVISYISAISLQHLIVCIICRILIPNHIDLDPKEE